jgi:hypothetical protein
MVDGRGFGSWNYVLIKGRRRGRWAELMDILLPPEGNGFIR